MALASKSSMLLLQHQELVLRTVRQLDQHIIDATGDLRLQRIRVYRVELSRYEQKEGMELIQDGVLHSGDNIKLV